MPKDSSLSDFAADASNDAVERDRPADDADSTDDGRAGEGDGTGSAGPGDGANGVGTVEPARATYEWTPDGATCASCDGTATRRWRLGDDLVCPNCKTW